MPDPLIITALAVLIIATITDLRTLEVPDWLSYGGIILGIAIHLILSAMQWSIWPALNSLIGLGIALALAGLMFYTAQWGGGDAKLLMAMGALIGFDANKFGFGASFLVNLVLMGAAWGVAYTLFLAARNAHKVGRTARTLLRQKPYARASMTSVIAATLALALGLIIKTAQLEFIALAAMAVALPALIILTKSVELSAMHHWVTPSQLVEGDWLVHSVKVGKKIITPPKLGLEETHLKELRKLKGQKVLVRYGVPFVPAFLIAYLVTLQWGNVVLAAMIGG